VTPYLIAHIVRGEPSFDIAILAEDMGTDTDPGPWWIMPSTGHRCYPFASWNVEDLADISDYPHEKPWTVLDKAPDDHPDFCHYTLAPASNPAAGLELLSKLGLIKPKEPLKRRI
jgi:hypothetical protein